MIDPGENSPDISYGTNGQKSACSSETLILEVESMTEDTKALRLKFDNYQKKIAENYPDVDPRALLNYEIHYREIDKATFEAENVTKYGGRDACGNDEWMIDDHQPSPTIVKAEGKYSWIFFNQI